MAAPVPLEELRAGGPGVKTEFIAAIDPLRDAKRVSHIVKLIRDANSFHDAIYVSQEDVTRVRRAGGDDDRIATAERILKIVVDRFEQMKAEGRFENSKDTLRDIAKLRAKFLDAAPERKKRLPRCDVAGWCGGDRISEDDGEALICDECGDAACGDCFQEIGAGFRCDACGRQLCDECCSKPEIEAILDNARCKKCEASTEKKKKVDSSLATLARAAEAKTKIAAENPNYRHLSPIELAELGARAVYLEEKGKAKKRKRA